MGHQSGRQFDPRILKVFLESMAEVEAVRLSYEG